MSDAENSNDAGWVAAKFAELRSAIATVIIGQDEAVRLSFVTLLCSGHSLYEGVPGVAKTLLVRTLAASLGVRFGRIQCTPDLMPSDIIGTPILQIDRADFRFRPGPLFTDLLLVDEINRAPAKTQAAMLEAMQERAATVDGTSHPLGEWFTVLATQNPIEQEGTYPLPEAELDRFLFKIRMDYPDADEEFRILSTHHAQLSPLAGAGVILTPSEVPARVPSRMRFWRARRFCATPWLSSVRPVSILRSPSALRPAPRCGCCARPKRSRLSKDADSCCPKTCKPSSIRRCGIVSCSKRAPRSKA